jgi:hypothetical protein
MIWKILVRLIPLGLAAATTYFVAKGAMNTDSVINFVRTITPEGPDANYNYVPNEVVKVKGELISTLQVVLEKINESPLKGNTSNFLMSSKMLFNDTLSTLSNYKNDLLPPEDRQIKAMTQEFNIELDKRLRYSVENINAANFKKILMIGAVSGLLGIIGSVVLFSYFPINETSSVLTTLKNKIF